MMETRSKY